MLVATQDTAESLEHGEDAALTLPRGWWPVAFDNEISGKPKSCRLGSLDLALYRVPDGALRAVEDRCPHRRLPLSMGWITEAGHIQCAYHGWAFDGVSGACAAIPNLHANEPLPPRHQVAAFPVAEAYGLVFVRTGETAGQASEPLRPGSRWHPSHFISVNVRAPHERIAEALLWNPGDALGLSPLGRGEELARASFEVGPGYVTAHRERVTLSFPRISTYRPLIELGARISIRASAEGSLTEITMQDAKGRLRLEIVAALQPVGLYRTIVRIGTAVHGARPADLVSRGILAMTTRKSLAILIQDAADAAESCIDPAVDRLRQERAGRKRSSS